MLSILKIRGLQQIADSSEIIHIDLSAKSTSSSVKATEAERYLAQFPSSFILVFDPFAFANVSEIY